MSKAKEPGMNEFALQAIAENITADGAKDIFVNATEEERIEILMAYFSDFSKKMDRIQVVYSTTPAAREEFNLMVLKSITTNSTSIEKSAKCLTASNG